jgi:hypothetical protein
VAAYFAPTFSFKKFISGFQRTTASKRIRLEHIAEDSTDLSKTSQLSNISICTISGAERVNSEEMFRLQYLFSKK